MTKEQLQDKCNNLYEILNNYNKIAKTEIEQLVNAKLPEWEVSYFESDTLSISLIEDNHINIEIYHGKGYDYNTDEEVFRYQMNCSAFGSFDMDDNSSTSWKYYVTVGMILSDENFNNQLKKILHTLYIDRKELRGELRQVRKELKAIREEELLLQMKEGQKNILSNINYHKVNYNKEYVVIKYTNLKNDEDSVSLATWKGKNVYFPLADIFTTTDEALTALKNYKSIYDKITDFKIVSIKTIK